MSRSCEIFRENRLLLSIIVAVVIGFIIGSSCHGAVHSSKNPSPNRIAMYVKFPGELFIRMLKTIIVPLITSSIIVALTEIGISSAGRLGKRTIIYYLATSLFSSILGLVLALTIQPGSGVATEESIEPVRSRESVDNILDLFRNAFPDNIVEAIFKSIFTKYTETPIHHRFKTLNISELTNMTAENMAKFLKNKNLQLVPESYISFVNHSLKDILVITNDVTVDFGGLMKGGGTNMIGLLVFSIAFGIVLNSLKDEGNPLIDIFKSLYKATMKLVDIIMWTSPIGIASIVAGNIVETKEISSMFRAIGLLLVTIVAGSLVIIILCYPTLYFFFFRRGPFKHLRNVLPALMTAFGTESSAATLPTTIQCCENGVKIDKRVTRFVLPIGATCNMDGAALFFAIIVPFIDQMEQGISLGIGDLIMTVLVSTLISFGAAGIPGAGLSNTIIVLEAIGLPVDNLGSILAIQWFVGRVGTVVNVMGDTYAAAFIGKMSFGELGDEKYELPNGDETRSEFETAGPTIETNQGTLAENIN